MAVYGGGRRQAVCTNVWLAGSGQEAHHCIPTPAPPIGPHPFSGPLVWSQPATHEITAQFNATKTTATTRRTTSHGEECVFDSKRTVFVGWMRACACVWPDVGVQCRSLLDLVIAREGAYQSQLEKRMTAASITTQPAATAGSAAGNASLPDNLPLVMCQTLTQPSGGGGGRVGSLLAVCSAVQYGNAQFAIWRLQKSEPKRTEISTKNAPLPMVHLCINTLSGSRGVSTCTCACACTRQWPVLVNLVCQCLFRLALVYTLASLSKLGIWCPCVFACVCAHMSAGMRLRACVHAVDRAHRADRNCATLRTVFGVVRLGICVQGPASRCIMH